MTELTVELTTLARLHVLAGPGRGQICDLSSERVSLGREPDNVLRLDDINVSHHHALLIWQGTTYKLRDLISTNGTYVNGQRTAATLLRDGDVLAIGEIEMRYRAVPLPKGGAKPVSVALPELTTREPVVVVGASKVEKPKSRFALAFGRRKPAAPAQPEPPTRATYRIVGADGRTYGPVNAEQLRQWISQGYANEQTWVPADLRRNWKRLSEFPEFAQALAASPAGGALLGVPPEESQSPETVKLAAPQMARGPVIADRKAAPLGEIRKPYSPAVPSVPRQRSAWRLLGWAVILILAACIGMARRTDRWPFGSQGPLKQFRSNVEGRIYSDPVYQAAAEAEEAKNYTELLKNAQTLTGRYPESSLAQYIMGVAYGKLGFVDEAVNAFRQAIKLKPDHIDAWNNLGWAYTLQGKFADAVAAFQETVELSPTDPQAWSNLGRTLTGQGKDAEAVDAYRKAIELRPGYAEAYYNLGVAYAGQGKYIEGLEALDKAIKLKPDFTEAWFNLGVVSQKQGQNGEAVVFYQQALKLKPDYADAWGGLVKAYMGLKQFKEAGEAAREMKRIDPEKANTLADELRAAAP
jgi:tetratricopeptide (TPR) repeat protein